MAGRGSASLVCQSQKYKDFGANTQEHNRTAKGCCALNHSLVQQHVFELWIVNFS